MIVARACSTVLGGRDGSGSSERRGGTTTTLELSTSAVPEVPSTSTPVIESEPEVEFDSITDTESSTSSVQTSTACPE
eukprot:SAG11_NODE_2490_length_3294_cov_3.906416_4_plen_78_part_00